MVGELRPPASSSSPAPAKARTPHAPAAVSAADTVATPEIIRAARDLLPNPDRSSPKAIP